MFHLLPGDMPQRESMLAPGELIVAVRLPAQAAQFAAHARYLKIRSLAPNAQSLAGNVLAHAQPVSLSHTRIADHVHQLPHEVDPQASDPPIFEARL